jgi:AsmA protein
VIKQQPVPERTGTPRTPFNALQGTASVASGVFTNNDLDVSTQYLKVSGQGSVNLPKNTLDYRLMATVLKFPRDGAPPETATEQDLVDAQIPVKISGTLSNPKVRPDLEGYLKGMAKQKLNQERDKVEQKVKEKLQDKLKDLFKR